MFKIENVREHVLRNFIVLLFVVLQLTRFSVLLLFEQKYYMESKKVVHLELRALASEIIPTQ
jgi:hypothetical protein